MIKSTKYSKLKEIFPGAVEGKVLAPLTTYKIGGKADLYYPLEDLNELPKLIEAASQLDIPYLIFGGGSNVVFSDKGYRGLIIHNKASEIKFEGNNLTCASGIPLAKVILEAKNHDLGGIARLIGLPGTIGGAIYGNAGAQGVEIGDFVEKATLYSKEKGVFEVKHDYFHFEYRRSILKKTKEFALTVTFKLPPFNKKDEMEAINKFRSQKQPKGFSAGSFFKNPSKELPAGYLIDKAGLKGTKVRGIEISDLHGNWLINKGKGTQKDLIKLAKKIIAAVEKRFDMRLKPENILLDPFGKRIDI